MLKDIGLVLPRNRSDLFTLVPSDTEYIAPVMKRAVVLLCFHSATPSLLMSDGSSILTVLTKGTTANLPYLQNQLDDIAVSLREILKAQSYGIQTLSITATSLDQQLNLVISIQMSDGEQYSQQLVTYDK